MKIIALQASPRKGGNCDVLMDEMIKGIEENGGEVVKYYLEGCEIAPCKACMYCAENPECIRADDGNKIIDELVQNKLLRYSKKDKSSTRGRKPIFVELNNDLGVVCCINFSSSDTRIVLATLDSTIVAEKIIPNVPFITKDVLVQTENELRNLLKDPNVSNKKLLSICIIAPGLLSSDGNGLVASRKVKAEDIIKVNPVLHFSNAFNVKVEMHNDVRIGCFGELKYSGSRPTVFFPPSDLFAIRLRKAESHY